jgi:hypothetical protein
MDPDFLEKISDPMDLSIVTIKKDRKGAYKTWNDYVRDIDLMINNMMRYFDANTREYQSACKMRDVWMELNPAVMRLLGVSDEVGNFVADNTLRIGANTVVGNPNPKEVRNGGASNVNALSNVNASYASIADPVKHPDTKSVPRTALMNSESGENDTLTTKPITVAEERAKERPKSPTSAASAGPATETIRQPTTETTDDLKVGSPVESASLVTEVPSGKRTEENNMSVESITEVPSRKLTEEDTKEIFAGSANISPGEHVQEPSQDSEMTLNSITTTRPSDLTPLPTGERPKDPSSHANSSQANSGGIPHQRSLVYIQELLTSSREAQSLIKRNSSAFSATPLFLKEKISNAGTLPAILADRKLRVALATLCDPTVQQMLVDFLTSRMKALLGSGPVNITNSNGKLTMTTTSTAGLASKLKLPVDDVALCMSLQLIQLKWQHEFGENMHEAGTKRDSSRPANFTSEILPPQEEIVRVALPLILLLGKTGNLAKDEMLDAFLHHECIQRMDGKEKGIVPAQTYFGSGNAHVRQLLTHIIDKIMP